MRVEEFLNIYSILEESLAVPEYNISTHLLESRKADIGVMLRNKMDSHMSMTLFQKSIDMVSAFSDMCGEKLCIDVNDIEYDPFVEDSIAIYFRSKNARINLYYNEDTDGDNDNFEEVYFSFEMDKKRHLVNDTMRNIMPLIHRILEL